MPGGLAFDSVQSYVAFGAVKFAGYSLFALYLKRQYPASGANFLVVGLVRTVIGMLFGAVAGIIGFWALEAAMLFFLLGLVPVRFAEWYLLLRLFFDRKNEMRNKNWLNMLAGVGCSFALDLPAIFGFIVTGGFWIC